MTKREAAEEAMRYGPIVAREAERVALLREAINEALEEAAQEADKADDYFIGRPIAHRIRSLKVAP